MLDVTTGLLESELEVVKLEAVLVEAKTKNTPNLARIKQELREARRHYRTLRDRDDS